MRIIPLVTAASLLVLLLFAFTGCETNQPRRSAQAGALAAATSQECQDVYAQSDRRIWQELTVEGTTDAQRQSFLDKETALIAKEHQHCWRTSYEPHPSNDPTHQPPFDYFVAEFDDQGMATDRVATKVAFEQTEI